MARSEGGSRGRTAIGKRENHFSMTVQYERPSVGRFRHARIVTNPTELHPANHAGNVPRSEFTTICSACLNYPRDEVSQDCYCSARIPPNSDRGIAPLTHLGLVKVQRLPATL